jgi:hypothetical protein
MSRDPHTLHIASHVPGRLRVRADKLCCEGAAAPIAERLRVEEGVHSIVHSEVTGSVLVLYDPQRIQLDRVLSLVLEAGAMSDIAVEAPRPPAGAPGGRFRAVLRHVDARACQAANGRIDIRTAVPATLLVAGLGRFVRGNRLVPKWYELVLWSFVTFVNLNPREHPAEPHADRAQ